MQERGRERERWRARKEAFMGMVARADDEWTSSSADVRSPRRAFHCADDLPARGSTGWMRNPLAGGGRMDGCALSILCIRMLLWSLHV